MTGNIRKSIDFMEQHLLEEFDCSDFADVVPMSPFYLQKGFKIMTGYTVGEYVRYRRLYLAALDVAAGKEKVIDLAYKYGYDTPESFTKAFSHFHGTAPSQVKRDSSKIRTFLPLKISILISGGNGMDVTFEKMKEFQVIGLEKKSCF